jgi:putative FmdB family regulatory protein
MEAFQRITEDALKDCPSCGKPSLQRLISSGNFMLKGGGWYKDGYGSQKDKKPRTENDRIDRLSKAIDEDKKKTADAESSAASAKDESKSTKGTESSGATTTSSAPTSGSGAGGGSSS